MAFPALLRFNMGELFSGRDGAVGRIRAFMADGDDTSSRHSRHPPRDSGTGT